MNTQEQIQKILQDMQFEYNRAISESIRKKYDYYDMFEIIDEKKPIKITIEEYERT